jgi:hypothetical protein
LEYLMTEVIGIDTDQGISRSRRARKIIEPA